MKNHSQLFNDLSRFSSVFGLFWITINPLLGFPFFTFSLIMGIKQINTKDGFYNVIFASTSILISILFLVFLLLSNSKN